MPEIRTGLIVLLLAIIPIPVASRAENISKESLKLARAELSNEIENGSIAGGAHMVVHDGQVLHFEIAGVSDIEDQTPLATDTIMRIYSMTKPITSAAAMTLHEQGKFNGKRVLKESTIALMFTDQLNGVNDDFKFGLGFAIGEVTLGSGDAQRSAAQGNLLHLGRLREDQGHPRSGSQVVPDLHAANGAIHASRCA